MPARHWYGTLASAAVVLCAALAAWVVPPPSPVTLTAVLPTAEHAVTVPVSDYLWPTTLDGDVEAWLDGDTALAHWLLADGRLALALVEATPDAIRVAGEPILALEDGRVPEDARRGGLVSRLYETLLDRHETVYHVGNATDSVLPRRVIVAVDTDLPAATLRQILFSIGEANLTEVAIVVADDAAPLLGGPKQAWRLLGWSPVPRRLAVDDTLVVLPVANAPEPGLFILDVGLYGTRR